jgi:N-acetylmuramoyl-L-alanine amidase
MIEIQNDMQNVNFPKIILLVLFLTLMVTVTPTAAEAASPAAVTVTVEGRVLATPVPPVIIADRTMVPVRFVSEAVGGQVEWVPEDRKVIVTRGADTVVLVVGKNDALVNGKPVQLEVAPQIVEDRTMVPLRFIAEALGGTVEWNPDTRTVNILRKSSAITAMSYTNGTVKATVVLTFSEPLLAVTPEATGTTVSFNLYPARVSLDQPERRIFDSLAQLLRLQTVGDGRTVRFEARLWSTPSYHYTLSADGTQLTIELDHTITQFVSRQDGRIADINILATGKLQYTAFALDGPPRLVLDVSGARLGADIPETLSVASPYVQQIRSAPKPDGARIVLDLKANVPADIAVTETGLQVKFVPRIQAVKTERLDGKTRLTLVGNLPLDAAVSAPAGQRKLIITVPQGRSELPDSLIKLADGTIDTISLDRGATATATIITVNLPYYLGHSVVSKAGDSSIVVDVVTSPVFGRRIWVDAGHGQVPGQADDPGTIGKYYKTYEKAVNLQVALELQRQLQEAGAIVYMTRTGDAGADFRDRPALVNATKPAIDLFISIHHNSAANVTVRGTETYYWTTNPKSRLAAVMIHASVLKTLSFPDRNVRTESFFVIKETKAPAVLVELGYLSNQAEETAIAEPGATRKTYPAKAAEGIRNGVLDFFWQEIRSAVAN